MPRDEIDLDNLDLDHLAESALPGVNAQHRETMAALKAIWRRLGRVLQKEDTLMASIDDVAADVTGETSVIDSLSTLMQGLKDQIAAALSGTNVPPAVQAKIDAVFATAETNKAKLAAAVLAGTPAADVPPAATA